MIALKFVRISSCANAIKAVMAINEITIIICTEFQVPLARKSFVIAISSSVLHQQVFSSFKPHHLRLTLHSEPRNPNTFRSFHKTLHSSIYNPLGICTILPLLDCCERTQAFEKKHLATTTARPKSSFPKPDACDLWHSPPINSIKWIAHSEGFSVFVVRYISKNPVARHPSYAPPSFARSNENGWT